MLDGGDTIGHLNIELFLQFASLALHQAIDSKRLESSIHYVSAIHAVSTKEQCVTGVDVRNFLDLSQHSAIIRYLVYLTLFDIYWWLHIKYSFAKNFNYNGININLL